MDEHDEKDEEQPASIRSGRVRIIGAEPAGQSVALPGEEPPAAPPVAEEPEARAPAPVEPAAPLFDESELAVPDLPHWTEAPTGEVPSVLSRDREPGLDDEDPWSSLPAPTWREENTDWAAGEDSFEPAMLADDEGRRGSLDDSGDTDRQPWTFDLPDADEATAAVPAVRGIDDFDDDETLVVPPPPRVVVPDEPDAGLDDATEAVAATPAVAPTPRGRRGRTTARPLRRRTRGEAADDEAAAAEMAAAGLASEPATATAPPSARRVTQGAPPGPPNSRLQPPEPPSPPPAGTGRRNMPVAVATGVALVLIALVVFDLGTLLTLVLVTVLVTIAAAEAYAAIRRGGYHPATLLGLVATVGLMIATYNKGQAALPLVAVLLFAFTMLWYIAGVERVDAVRGTAATLLVFGWVSVFGSFAALLLAPSLFPDRHGIAFLLGAVITGAACDIGALLVGSRFGSHPMAPTVSPGKTWEGAVGGAVAAILAAVIIVHFIHPWTLSKAFWLGVVVAVVSPLGDLAESAFKRSLGLKDMSHILPGHGGLLDRVDGLLFVLPATYYLVKALHLG